MTIASKLLLAGAGLLSLATLTPVVHAGPAAHNVVLVHGAFADGSGWKGVYERLTAKGFKVIVVQEPETSLEDDVAATKRAISGSDGPVVLVGHSYGGQVITEAGTDPKVVALVYAAAIASDIGESVATLSERIPPPVPAAARPVDGYLVIDPDKFHANFCADLPKEQGDFMAHSQVTTNVKCFETPAKVAAWKDKPTYGIVAEGDKTINPDLERFMYKRANAKITEVPGASHAVYVSHPDAVAKVIEEAAKQ